MSTEVDASPLERIWEQQRQATRQVVGWPPPLSPANAAHEIWEHIKARRQLTELAELAELTPRVTGRRLSGSRARGSRLWLDGGVVDEIEVVTDEPRVVVRLRGRHRGCVVCRESPGLCALHSPDYEAEPYKRSSQVMGAGVAPEPGSGVEGPESGAGGVSEGFPAPVRDVPDRGLGQR